MPFSLQNTSKQIKTNQDTSKSKNNVPEWVRTQFHTRQQVAKTGAYESGVQIPAPLFVQPARQLMQAQEVIRATNLHVECVCPKCAHSPSPKLTHCGYHHLHLVIVRWIPNSPTRALSSCLLGNFSSTHKKRKSGVRQVSLLQH